MIKIQPGSLDSTSELQAAIDSTSRKGGGIVRLLPGIHSAGTLHLRSNLTLEIPAGAILRGLSNADAYQAIQSSIPSRMDVVPWKAFIHADSIENVRIQGSGTIYGAGDSECFKDVKGDDPNSPYGMHFVNCHNVQVEGIHLRNSSFWMQRYFHCDGVRVRGINVYNHANKNNDGIDIDSSQNVTISDSTFDTSDDAICIKSEGKRPARNITVSNCILGTHASGLKLGTGSVGGFENIVFSNIVMRRSASTDMRHPLNFWGGITGIDLSSMDGGALRAVNFSNIVIDGFSCPILLRLGNRLSGSIAEQGFDGAADFERGVQNDENATPIQESKCFEDVSICQVTARNLGPYPIIAMGYPGAPLRRITLRDITLTHAEAAAPEESGLPTDYKDSGYPGPWTFDSKLPSHGIFTRGVENLTVENLQSTPASNDSRPLSYEIAL